MLLSLINLKGVEALLKIRSIEFRNYGGGENDKAVPLKLLNNSVTAAAQPNSTANACLFSNPRARFKGRRRRLRS
jgi:hypothetical protein